MSDLISQISRDAREALLNCPWKGNVRELQNELRRAFILESDYRPQPMVTAKHEGEGHSMEDAEKRAILHALDATCGNKRKAAELLGIPRSTLYLKLSKYRIF